MGSAHPTTYFYWAPMNTAAINSRGCFMEASSLFSPAFWPPWFPWDWGCCWELSRVTTARGWITLFMRAAEIFMALPWIYLLFAVRAFLPLHLGAQQSFFLLVGVIGLTGWARPSRLVRGVVMSAKHRDYVLAARSFGASHFYLLRRHVLPETYGVLLTQAAVLIPQYILAEVTLSFLGLGVSEPAPSWGNMLADMQKLYVLESYWWMFAAGVALIPVFLLYHLLADALQQRFS